MRISPRSLRGRTAEARTARTARTSKTRKTRPCCPLGPFWRSGSQKQVGGRAPSGREEGARPDLRQLSKSTRSRHCVPARDPNPFGSDLKALDRRKAPRLAPKDFWGREKVFCSERKTFCTEFSAFISVQRPSWTRIATFFLRLQGSSHPKKSGTCRKRLFARAKSLLAEATDLSWSQKTF
jgi:hypothetical protein